MVVLDSSFLIAFKVLNDVHHGKAAKLMRDIVDGEYGRPFVTDYIFDETITGILVRSKKLGLATEYGNELLRSLEILNVSEEIFAQAWDIFTKQRSSDLSFTDSTTLAVMSRHRIKNVATFDKDFWNIKGINVVGVEQRTV
jgi:predicted nucleic acid-binding protein